MLRKSAQRWLGYYFWKLASGVEYGGQHVTVNDVQIYYETFGVGSPVLVLHGGLGSIEGMSYQIRALAPSYFVIAPDSRGHGRSSPLKGSLTYSLMADDMIGVLDYLKIDRADIVGWSDGGIVGLDLAIRYPDRVGKLVAISANYDVSGLIGRQTVKDDPWEDTIPNPPLRYRLLARRSVDWPTLYRSVHTMWHTQPHYRKDDLRRIRAPTLIMAGANDIVRREHTDELVSEIPASEKIIIEGTTHNVVIDDPRRVNAAVVRFLSVP